MGILTDWRIPLTYQTHEHDVLVIGAGGAGLRAAIEASAAGVKVGLICKSLLGKAHTVMAEGGIAAALANVDDRDSWKVHFADTMRGGQYVNNWRMAELHAKEAPDRVRELEAWGAVFDRTTDGRILQRNFGGHRYPRLAHVGDRTGLEMIRTLQDHGIHRGIDVHMEFTVVALLHRRRPRRRRVRLRARARPVQAVSAPSAVVLATGGIGRAYKITSNSWEGTGDGHALAYHAGAELIDMEFIQFHPTGMIWPPSVQGILVTEGVRGEGGVLRNSEGRRFMFDDIPENYRSQTADNPEEGWRYTQGDKNARRPPELLTRDHVARCIMREVQGGPRQPARRRLPRHRLDQGEDPERAGAHPQASCRACITSSRSWPTSTSPRADGGRTDDALRHGRHPRGRGHADVDDSRAVRGRRMRRRHQRRQPARRQFAVGPAGVRQARRRVRRAVREGERRSRRSTSGQVDAAAKQALEPFERGNAAARTRTRSSRICRT